MPEPGELIHVRLGAGIVKARVVRVTECSVWVELPDGHIVKRKNSRDLVDAV